MICKGLFHTRRSRLVFVQSFLERKGRELNTVLFVVRSFDFGLLSGERRVCVWGGLGVGG